MDTVTEQSVVLSFTQVDDGTGQPADYAIGYSTATITSFENIAATVVSVEGTEVGANREYEYTGLNAETEYRFGVVAVRGSLDSNPTYGELSNIVLATTLGSSEPPPPPPPPPGPGEPFFGANAADVLIWQDGFEYQCIGTGQCGDQAFGVNYEVNGSEFTNNTAIVAGGRPGSSGSKILEMRYGVNQAHNLAADRSFSITDHFFFQIWFKTTAGWNPTQRTTSGIKGFMFFHEEDEAVFPRYQWGVSKLGLDLNTCGNSGSTPDVHFGGTGRSAISGPHCQSYVWEGRPDDSRAPPWTSNVNSPWPNGFNDGQWHRVTMELKAGSSPEYMKWWYDGILVWDDTSVGANYPRPNVLRWFGNFPNFGDESDDASIYFDDLVLWRR